MAKKPCRRLDATYRYGRTMVPVFPHTKKVHKDEFLPCDVKAAPLAHEDDPKGIPNNDPVSKSTSKGTNKKDAVISKDLADHVISRKPVADHLDGTA